MKFNWLFLIGIFVLLAQCKVIKTSDKNSKFIKASLLSDQFDDFLKTRGMYESKEVIIYNETNIANGLEIIKSETRFLIKKIDFEYNVNIPSKKPIERKIILYKFESKQKRIKLYYLSIPDNGVIIFEYNNKCELASIEGGII